MNRRNNVNYSVKIININLSRQEDTALINEEIDILKSLAHPNILEYVEHVEENEHFYIISEDFHGGELFDRIVQKSFYNESEAQELVYNLLSAIKHIHDVNIVHRDIKPETILLNKALDDTDIKLTDFSLAYKLPTPVSSFPDTAGTPDYLSPDVILGKPAGKPVDMWAVGVNTYILLAGYSPFSADQGQEVLFKKILRVQYEFHSEFWATVSEEAKDFIRRLLNPNPLQRLTVDEALQHTWVRRCWGCVRCISSIACILVLSTG